MWYRLKNLFLGLKTYDTLSPNMKLRRWVNRDLRQRPGISLGEWFGTFYQAQGISYAVAAFAYTNLEQYSGLSMAHVRPTDRLEADLRWTQVCWFDWDLSLCDDFLQWFEVDISDCLNTSPLITVGDLVLMLQHQLEAAQTLPHPASYDEPC